MVVEPLAQPLRIANRVHWEDPAAVLILDGDPAAVAPMAGQAVRLADLKDLPHLLGMLVPRRLA